MSLTVDLRTFNKQSLYVESLAKTTCGIVSSNHLHFSLRLVMTRKWPTKDVRRWVQLQWPFHQTITNFDPLSLENKSRRLDT